MSEFSTFLQLGFQHIADLTAYDHLLFLLTLCAPYRISEWKKVLILVTAFTLGHSLTLALSALDIFRLNQDLVEFLIPITILITSFHNIIVKKSESGIFSKTEAVSYAIALFFGLIHGMGFAGYFRSLMGDMGGYLQPLLAFNVGIELGQAMIVALFFVLHWALVRIFTIPHRDWNVYISGAGGGVAIVLILQALFK